MLRYDHFCKEQSLERLGPSRWRERMYHGFARDGTSAVNTQPNHNKKHHLNSTEECFIVYRSDGNSLVED